MKKLIVFLFIILAIYFCPMPTLATNLDDINQKLGDIDSDLKSQQADREVERSRQEFNKTLDQLTANQEARMDMKARQEERKSEQKWEEDDRKFEKERVAKKEEYIAKKKKECEDQRIKWGETPKEAEDSCKGLIESIRGVMETPSPKEIEWKERQKKLEDSEAILDSLLASGHITEGEYNRRMKKLLDDYKEYQKTESQNLKRFTDSITNKK